MNEFEVIPQFIEQFTFSEKLNLVKFRVVQAFNSFFQKQSLNSRATLSSSGDIGIQFENLYFSLPITLASVNPSIGGFYIPQFHETTKTRPIFINIYSLFHFDVDDIAYIIIHEAVHAGAFCGAEIYDEGTTDTFALDICEAGGLKLSFSSGYADLRASLNQFGERVTYWQNQMQQAENPVHKGTDEYQDELSNAIVSLVFGDESLSSFSWSYIENKIWQHKALLESIFPRLISLANVNQMSDQSLLNIAHISEALQKEMARQFWGNQKRVDSLVSGFANYYNEELITHEDAIVDKQEVFLRFLQEKEAMYLWDFDEEREEIIGNFHSLASL